MSNSIEMPQKIRNRTTISSSSSTPEYLSEESKSTNSKRYMNSCVHCSIIYNSQCTEEISVLINRWMYEEDTCIQWTITHPQKEWNLAICVFIDRSRGYYANGSKSYREGQKLCFQLFVESEKTKQMNKYIYTETESKENKQVIAREEEICEGD